jgi:predicted DNA-binding protein
MPISLRLPNEIETELARASAALGITKTALIHRGIEAYLRDHALPTAHDLYLRTQPSASATRDTPIEQREHKQRFREAMHKKQAQRKARSAA